MTKLETEFTSELLAALEQAETITGIGEARLAETARSRGGAAAVKEMLRRGQTTRQFSRLAELGRLLTFMSEEDRQEALTLYAKMFDDVTDEQALLQSLLSPTRQAVIIARAYDANARKLQARAKSRRDEDEDDTPDFVMAILHVYEECVPLLPEEEVTEEDSVMANQFSLFEDDGQPTEESVYEETFVLHETPEVPSQPDEGEEALPEEGEALSPAPEAEVAAETAEEPDEVDAFIANFSIQDNEIAEAPAKSTPLVLEERRVDSVDEEEEVRALVEDLLALRLPGDWGAREFFLPL